MPSDRVGRTACAGRRHVTYFTALVILKCFFRLEQSQLAFMFHVVITWPLCIYDRQGKAKAVVGWPGRTNPTYSQLKLATAFIYIFIIKLFRPGWVDGWMDGWLVE